MCDREHYSRLEARVGRLEGSVNVYHAKTRMPF